MKIKRDLKIAPLLSQEQELLNGLFGSGDKAIFSGEGRNLPELNGSLTPRFFGYENETQTAESFGIIKGETGRFFGI